MYVSTWSAFSRAVRMCLCLIPLSSWTPFLASIISSYSVSSLLISPTHFQQNQMQICQNYRQQPHFRVLIRPFGYHSCSFFVSFMIFACQIVWNEHRLFFFIFPGKKLTWFAQILTWVCAVLFQFHTSVRMSECDTIIYLKSPGNTVNLDQSLSYKLVYYAIWH